MITDTLRQASDNAAAFWTVLAEARGYRLLRGPGFLTVSGTERYGMRVMVMSPEVPPEALRPVVADRPPGPCTVEDPFGTVTVDGLTPRELPVMIREPAPAPPPARPVSLVTGAGDLAAVERIVVDGFPLSTFQPYRPGEVFPASLLDRDDIAFFRLGDAGAAVTLVAGGVVGAYWVTTMPEHRSQGVGRALMLATLARHPDLPMTLTASRAGRPLYESMGFVTITGSTWWA